MCTINDRKWRIAKKDMVVYKVISPNYNSEVAPNMRPLLPGFKTRGLVLFYKTGTVLKSPSGPGIMAYKNKKTAEKKQGSIKNKEQGSIKNVVRLTIRKGTKYRTGRHWGHNIITAQQVYVGKVYPTI